LDQNPYSDDSVSRAPAASGQAKVPSLNLTQIKPVGQTDKKSIERPLPSQHQQQLSEEDDVSLYLETHINGQTSM
jgi:hypothetical protein